MSTHERSPMAASAATGAPSGAPSVRAKRGRWPDDVGDYEIRSEGGGTLLWVEHSPHYPDTEAVAERILAAINGDTVPEGVSEQVQDLRDRLYHAPTVGPTIAAIARDAINALAAAPTLPDDLPSWVSMHATATGADLIEHDPNGEVWERCNVWARCATDHARHADPTITYLVRRRSAPVEQATEKVLWWEALRDGRRLPRVDGPSDPIESTGRYEEGHRWLAKRDGTWLADVDPDGMVTVLVEPKGSPAAGSASGANASEQDGAS